MDYTIIDLYLHLEEPADSTKEMLGVLYQISYLVYVLKSFLEAIHPS